MDVATDTELELTRGEAPTAVSQQRPGRARLVSVEELPASHAYLQRYHVQRGYVIGGSHWEAAHKVLFTSNNETMNAWTMVWAFCVCSALYLHAGLRRTPEQMGPLRLFYASAFIHLPFSVFCACFLGISERAKERWRLYDVFLIFSCGTLRGLALGRVVFGAWAPLYWGPLLAVYAACIHSTLWRRGLKSIPRARLVWDIAAICLAYTFPLAWQAGAELLGAAPGGPLGGPALRAYTGLLACLGLSAYVCSQHVPEKWAPGRFDIVGASHQLMHLLVLGEYCCEWGFLMAATGALQ